MNRAREAFEAWKTLQQAIRLSKPHEEACRPLKALLQELNTEEQREFNALCLGARG